MGKTLNKLKTKAFRAFRPSGYRDLSADREPATADAPGARGRGYTQILPAQNPVPKDTATRIPATQAKSTKKSMATRPWDVSICELWDVAYQNLREENPELINKYEGFILKDMSAAFSTMIPVGPFKREQMQFVLQRKIDEVNRYAWKLKFGNSSEIEVKEMVEPVLGVIKWANNYISQALSGSPQASIAWAGISLFLPLLLNPSEQASSLAKALEYISSLILQGRMREELFIRRCESGTGPARPQGISPKIYKVQFTIPSSSFRAKANQKSEQDGLEKLYRQILTLQAEAYCYYAGNTSRLARDIVKWDDWKSLLDAVKDQEYSFSQLNKVWKDAKYDEECKAAQKRHEERRCDLQAIGADLSGLRQAIYDAYQDKNRSKLLSWLCQVDHSVLFNSNRNRHEKGTSEWLLKDCEEFTTWQKEPASFLWLHGKAGSGKSVLSSAVINHLRTTYKADPEKALAYFYFNFTDTQSTDTMISSLIKQLCARRPTVPPAVVDFYEYMDRGDRPDTGMLEKALLDTTYGFSTVYLILDGLDECPTINDQRRQLMRSLCRWLSELPSNVRLFCTSRKEPDILAKLEPFFVAPHRNALDLTQGTPRLALDRDIRLYIASTLQSTDYKFWSPDLKREVQDALIDKADGMFQYVFLQLVELRRTGVSSPSRIRQKLSSLPQGLDETYDRMLQRIDESVRTEVRAMLMWLAFGGDDNNEFDVTLETLAQVLLFQPNRDGVVHDDDQLCQAEEILKFMPGLVITFVPESAINEWKNEPEYQRRLLEIRGHWAEPISTSESEKDLAKNEKLAPPPKYVYVRIAHFSVQEYLISDRILQGPAKLFAFSEIEAHVYIAQTWLAYHFYGCSLDTNQPQRHRINLGKTNPDVSRQWAYHMEAASCGYWPQKLKNDTLRALAPRSKSFSCLGQTLTFAHLSVKEAPGEGVDRFIREMLLRPYCCTAFCGWLSLTELLLSGSSSRYLTQLDFDAVLYHAAYNGHVNIVQLALQRGANIHSRHLRRPRNYNPIGRGYDDPILQTMLQTASENGHLTTVEFLLAHGADINARDSLGQSVLHTLVRQEQYRPNTVTFFLDRGADVNALDNEGCSVLNAAMSSYKLDLDSNSWIHTIRLLVDRGADPRSCTSSLGMVYSTGLEATRYLLDKGANVNQSDPSGQTALHKVVAYKGEDLFRLLLERGADVNVVGKENAPSVLQAACYSNFGLTYLPHLLNKGADPAAPPGCWGSAIHATCVGDWSRHDEDCLPMARMVLDAGAVVTAEGGEYGYPLQAAVVSSHGNLNLGRELVELLLERGADVNAQGGKYGSALQAACQLNDPDLVQYLLDQGADPNAQGGKFGNPLTAAVGESFSQGGEGKDIFRRNVTNVMEIVRLLLNNGARVNAGGNGRYGTALQAAAGNAPADVVRLLLKRGAHVNGPNGGLYGTALQAACAKRLGDPSVLGLLLEHGADVLARGGKYGSAFHAAVLSHPKTLLSTDTLELLLASEPSLDVNDMGGPGGTTAIQGLMGTNWAETPVTQRPEETDWTKKRGRRHGYKAVVRSIRHKVQLLVEHGVDVNLGGGIHGSPLQAACALDREVSFERAEMLLDLYPAVEVNNPGGLFGSPLQAAAYSGQTETVRRLLKRKADVHARGGRYGSALNAAILRDHWDIVEILRGAGAKADCEIMEIPDQVWLWQMEREEHVYWFDRFYAYNQYGEDAVARYRKFWEVETGKEMPVERVMEWLFG